MNTCPGLKNLSFSERFKIGLDSAFATLAASDKMVSKFNYGCIISPDIAEALGFKSGKISDIEVVISSEIPEKSMYLMKKYCLPDLCWRWNEKDI